MDNAGTDVTTNHRVGGFDFSRTATAAEARVVQKLESLVLIGRACEAELHDEAARLVGSEERPT